VGEEITAVAGTLTRVSITLSSTELVPGVMAVRVPSILGRQDNLSGNKGREGQGSEKNGDLSRFHVLRRGLERPVFMRFL
jgi:hypothetical protein